MAKILYVEDNPVLAESIKDWLEAGSHNVEIAETAEDALQLTTHFGYEVILLDWDLPGMSGLDFCKFYRESGGSAWVIFLTGRNDIGSMESALELGGDDYVTKPFEPREITARVNACLRRLGSFKSELMIGDLLLDRHNRRVHVQSESIHLLPKECALLEFLMRNADRTFSTKDLLSAVWSSEQEVSEGVVRTYIRQIRIKLKTLNREDLIQSNSGRGYVIYSHS